jgi:hypothetical protein
MDKNQVYKAAFETIKESTEWGMGSESKGYGNWVDGVVTMTDNILNIINNENGRSVPANN